MNHLIDSMLTPVTRWAEESQRQACRNAMVASTALSAGRQERDEVEEYVATTLAHRKPRTSAALHAREARVI